ncbi:MAG: 50S ribosomal protein L2, partial [Cyanobacteriota bacterium]
MGIRTFRPYTPSTRQMTVSSFEELSRDENGKRHRPEKSL